MNNNWTLLDLLTLTNIKGLNDKERFFLVNNYGSLAEVFDSKLPQVLQSKLNLSELFETNTINYDFAKIQIEKSEENNCKIVSYWNNDYPILLKEIYQPPLLLFVKGNLSNPVSVSISVVGTRKNSMYGKIITENFVSRFARNGIITVSGMANGIDSIAHKTAMAEKGITYAVLASGLNKISPSHANEFAEKIVDSGGCLITFFPFNTSALPPYFLLRNRIIAGLSAATLLTECDYKSGALNTARHAVAEGRDVFAVPGNVTSNKSNGTNKLLKDGNARIATAPEDILAELGYEINDKKVDTLINFKDEKEKTLYDKLSLEPIHIDSLLDDTQMEISEILVKLLEMEFAGVVKQLPGKYYIKSI